METVINETRHPTKEENLMSNITSISPEVKAQKEETAKARSDRHVAQLIQSLGTLTAAGFTCTTVEYGVDHPRPPERPKPIPDKPGEFYASNYPRPAVKIEYGDYSETFDIYYNGEGTVCVDLYGDVPETKYKDLPEAEWHTVPNMFGKDGTLTIKRAPDLTVTDYTERQRVGWWKPKDIAEAVINNFDSEEQFPMKTSYNNYCRQYAVIGCKFPDLLPTPEPAATAPTPTSPMGPIPAVKTVSCGLDMVTASSIKAVPVQWMWKGFLVDGKLNMIAGDPGVSKSMLTVMLAAHISTGRDWPDGSPCQQGDFIIFSAEDEPDDTIKPRLHAAGADMNHVWILNAIKAVKEDGTVHEKTFTISEDIAHLKQAMDQLPNLRGMSIDPLNSYIGGDTNTNADNEMRAILKPLVELIAVKKVCTVLVSHLNKDVTKNAIHRVIGSIGSVGLSRVVWGVTKDKDDPERRLVTNIKANLAKDTEGLAYRITEREVWLDDIKGDLYPVVEFEKDRLDLTAEDVMVANCDGRQATVRDELSDFIVDQLQAGPMRSDDLMHLCEGAGYVRSTVTRARKAAGVLAKKKGQVWWSAMPKDAVLLNNCSDEDLSSRGELPSFLR